MAAGPTQSRQYAENSQTSNNHIVWQKSISNRICVQPFHGCDEASKQREACLSTHLVSNIQISDHLVVQHYSHWQQLVTYRGYKQLGFKQKNNSDFYQINPNHLFLSWFHTWNSCPGVDFELKKTQNLSKSLNISQNISKNLKNSQNISIFLKNSQNRSFSQQYTQTHHILQLLGWSTRLRKSQKILLGWI